MGCRVVGLKCDRAELLYLFVRLVPFREADWLTDCLKEVFATAKKGYIFAVD